MVNKKIMIKNNATLTGVAMMMLITIAVFSGGFLYVSSNVSDAGVILDDKYNKTYNDLNTSFKGIENHSRAMQTNLDDISEATDIWQVAWNGLKGLGNALKAPVYFITPALGIYNTMASSLSFLPGWLLPVISAAFLIFIVFLVLKVLKGEPNM